MEWVLARAASVARSVLVFLGASPFRLKRPVFEKVLDFGGDREGHTANYVNNVANRARASAWTLL